MIHFCEATVITCGDFRLHQRKDGRNYVANLIRFLNIDCDIVTVPGGVFRLVGSEKEARKILIEDVETYSKLHHSKMILALNHENCGVYGSFQSRDMEIHRHFRDMEKAEEVLRKFFPRKKIIKLFAELQTGTADVFTVTQCGNYFPDLPIAIGW